MSAPDSAQSPHPGLSFPAFVVMMAALQAVGALGVDSMLPNLPAISATFALPAENQRQLVVTAYLMGFGGGQIVYGALADRFGRRTVLLAGLAIYVFFSALGAFSPSFALLVTARVLQGVGAAATRALPVSIVRDCYAGRQMARVMSLSFMVFLAVPMMAPSVGTVVGLFASWRWVFGVLTLFGGAVFIWVALKLPETMHPEDRTPIVLSRIAHNFSLAARNRTAMGYTGAMTFVMGSLIGFINSVQQVFGDVFKATALFPLVFAIIAGCMSVASLLNARWVGRLGMRPLAHGAVLAMIASSALHAALALSGRETLVTFTIFQGISMFCLGCLFGNLGAVAMEPMGHVAGAAASLQGFISMFGGALIGFLIGQQFNGTAAPIAVGYVLCGLGALVCVMFAEKGRLFRPHPVAQAV